MKKNNYFPLFVDLADKTVLIFGGGRIATRRATALAQFQTQIIVVAERISEQLWRLKEESDNLTLICQSYAEYDFETRLQSGDIPFYVIAATNLTWLNHDIAHLCQQYQILMSNASASEDCSVYFPAVASTEDLTVGVVSEKKKHKKVMAFAAKIRELLKGQEQSV